MKLFIIFTVLVLTVSAISDRLAWTSFKTEYSKDYEIIEDRLRFKIFQNSLRLIEEHNAKYEKGEVSYFLKTTKFADYTDEEREVLLRIPDGGKREVKKPLGTFVPTLNANLPDSVDWREKGAVRNVSEQQFCSSSYAFSATGALEGQYTILKNQDVTLSVQELVDCSGNHGNTGCEGGYATWSYYYVQDIGLASEEQYPYTGVTGECQSPTGRVVAPIQGHVELLPNEDALLEAVAFIGPISTGINATASWLLYGGGVFDDECTGFPNVDCLAVGYGTEDKDYWILKHSWGENWGEKGYMRLARGKNLCGINLFNSYPVL